MAAEASLPSCGRASLPHWSQPESFRSHHPLSEFQFRSQYRPRTPVKRRCRRWLWWAQFAAVITALQFLGADYFLFTLMKFIYQDDPSTSCVLGLALLRRYSSSSKLCEEPLPVPEERIHEAVLFIRLLKLPTLVYYLMLEEIQYFFHCHGYVGKVSSLLGLDKGLSAGLLRQATYTTARLGSFRLLKQMIEGGRTFEILHRISSVLR